MGKVLQEVTDMTPKQQSETLKNICKKISEMEDDELESVAEVVLDKLIEGLDETDQDDGFGTEGWAHFFGYDG